MGTLIGAAAALLLTPVLLLSAAAAGFLGGSPSPATGRQPAPSATAAADIPAGMLLLYQQAATAECPGLPWTVLAAVGKAESDHGRSALPGVHSGANPASGAQGPMQFLPFVFHAYARPVPPGGAAPPSPYDPADTVYAAARYLCATGARAGADIPAAIFAYNHDPAYVGHVLATADSYTATAAPGYAAGAAARAVAFAQAQLGQPYQWGGDGAEEGGFDCSGLTHAAYAAAGIDLPRTADQQWRHGPTIPSGQPLAPGDLLFYGLPGHASHVTLYAASNRVIHAPQPGQPVQYATVWAAGFLGATRPANHQ